MSYTAPNRLLMPMRHSIDTASDSWLSTQIGNANQSAWPSANLAIYVPLRIPSRVVVRTLWFANNNTSYTGNVDMALYDAAGVAVVSATNAAKSSATGEQVFDVTDTPVGPGLFYIGLSSDSGTDTFYRWNPPAPLALSRGVWTEASAYPLPSTATFTLNQTFAYIPVMGLLVEATVT